MRLAGRSDPRVCPLCAVECSSNLTILGPDCKSFQIIFNSKRATSQRGSGEGVLQVRQADCPRSAELFHSGARHARHALRRHFVVLRPPPPTPLPGPFLMRHGAIPQAITPLHMPGVLTRAARQGQPVRVPDAASPPRCSPRWPTTSPGTPLGQHQQRQRAVIKTRGSKTCARAAGRRAARQAGPECF